MSDSAVCEPEELTEEALADQTTDSDLDERYRQLRAWTAGHNTQECCPAQIFNAIRLASWSRENAVRVLLETLPPSLHDEVRLLARPAPEADFSGSPSSVTIDGHTVRVVCDMRNPRVVVFGNLLSADECRELIATATPRLHRSTVVSDGSGSDVSDVRTSSGMFLERDETPVHARIEARIASLLDWPIACLEQMQVLRYGKEQEYEPHHDYFEPPEGPWAPVFRHGGQRVASLVIYLNTPALGGSTVFPEIPLEVRPVAGNAVFFAYETPDASSRTLHGGAPVHEGEKWVAVKWFRQGRAA
jgi:prolyl 4-hydroxylase